MRVRPHAMHLRSLKVFCDVVRQHSFSKAAVANAMTQSGASQAVQQLEEHLQVQLIDRSKRPFLLTPEGEAFHAGCEPLLRQFESLEAEVRSLGHEVCGPVSVAAIYSVGLSYLQSLKRLIAEQYPKATVRFQLGHPLEVVQQVERGLVDFGLVSFPSASETIKTTHWRDERMLLVAPKAHALASQPEITPEDLNKQSCIGFAPHLQIRQAIDGYLQKRSVTPEITAELDNIDSVKHAMEVNESIAFLPRPTVLEELRTGQFVELNCPWLELIRPLGIIRKQHTSLHRTARSVMELVQSVGRDLPELPNANPAAT